MADILALAKDTANMDEGRERDELYLLKLNHSEFRSTS